MDKKYLSSENWLHYKQLLGFATFKIIVFTWRIVLYCTHKKLLQFSKHKFTQVCYSMTDPPSKEQKEVSPVDKKIETIIFLFPFLLLSVTTFSLFPWYVGETNLRSFPPTQIWYHPHKQIIYRTQLLQIECHIVNQGLSASKGHQSLNSA